MKTFKTTSLAIAIASAYALTGSLAHAQDSSKTDKKSDAGSDSKSTAVIVTPTVVTTPADNYWSDRRYMQQQTAERAMLEDKLNAAKTVDGLKQIISENGYMLTAIIEQSAEELEYEIVKDNQSFEVSADLDGADALTSIEVSNNIWRADETERAMQDSAYTPTAPVYDPVMSPRYRDTNRMVNWDREQDILASQLAAGESVETYKQKLQEMGYQITSINDSEPDYTEFEIVKAGESFEVQLDKNASTNKVTEIDITTNMWQSKETERALAE